MESFRNFKNDQENRPHDSPFDWHLIFSYRGIALFKDEDICFTLQAIRDMANEIITINESEYNAILRQVVAVIEDSKATIAKNINGESRDSL